MSDEDCRRALLWACDPGVKLDALSTHSVRDSAIAFVVLLPDFIGRDERLEMWETIAKAIGIANAEQSGDDFAAWSCIVLKEIRCEVWRAAVHEGWSNFQQDAEAKGAEYREALIECFTRKLAAVLPLARARYREINPDRTKAKGGE